MRQISFNDLFIDHRFIYIFRGLKVHVMVPERFKNMLNVIYSLKAAELLFCPLTFHPDVCLSGDRLRCRKVCSEPWASRWLWPRGSASSGRHLKKWSSMETLPASRTLRWHKHFIRFNSLFLIKQCKIQNEGRTASSVLREKQKHQLSLNYQTWQKKNSKYSL